MKNCKLNQLIKTDLGEITVKSYLNKVISAGGTFYETSQEDYKTQKCFIALGSKATQISRTQYNYLIEMDR